MSVKKESFGKTRSGQEVFLYTIGNSSGNAIGITDYGATLQSVVVGGVDVILGYSDVAGLEADQSLFGAIIGRNANRMGGAQFKLNGITYHLEPNEDENNLHSGPDVFSKRFWEAEVRDSSVTFRLHSPEGDQGFPGDLDIAVTYSFDDNNTIGIQYNCKASEDTICNLTCHPYFNLNGAGNGDILGHSLQLNASHITEVDSEMIVTGKLLPVKDGPFDFTAPKTIGQDFNTPHPQLEIATGYDHNFCMDGEGFRDFGTLVGNTTGITMKIRSDAPGMMVYTGNYLHENDNLPGKHGVPYNKYEGVALETQFYPNAINIPAFKSPILRAGETWESRTEFILTG